MAKIHPIETCIGCGAEIKPLIRENREVWERLHAFVTERLEISKDKFIEILTPHLMIHDEADVIYCLCDDCCRDALHQLLRQIITRHRRILFWNFDKIREELKQ